MEFELQLVLMNLLRSDAYNWNAATVLFWCLICLFCCGAVLLVCVNGVFLVNATIRCVRCFCCYVRLNKNGAWID
ncbi:hypothetical protein CsSME_00027658 [Camellia sinensis var. sinensis]